MFIRLVTIKKYNISQEFCVPHNANYNLPSYYVIFGVTLKTYVYTVQYVVHVPYTVGTGLMVRHNVHGIIILLQHS